MSLQSASKDRAVELPALPLRIVVGSDGSSESMGALRLAAALQRANGARIHAISAVEYTPVFMIPTANVEPPRVEEGRRRAALAQLKRQGRSVRPVRPWTLSAVIGWPTEAILDLADQWNGDAIIVGIGRHRPVDRLLAHETAIAIVRHARVPVLAVAPDTRALPKRAIAAIDFTASSIEAARLAAALLASNGTLTLVHASPFQASTRRDGVAWTEVYETGARDRLTALRDELRADGVNVKAVIIRGFAGDELLRYAKRRRADLIAVGGHKQGFVDRMVIGSITTRVLRGSHATVLVVPERRPLARSTRKPSRR